VSAPLSQEGVRANDVPRQRVVVCGNIHIQPQPTSHPVFITLHQPNSTRSHQALNSQPHTMFSIVRSSASRAAYAPARRALATRFASTSTTAQKKAEDGQDAVGEGLKKAGKALQVGLRCTGSSFGSEAWSVDTAWRGGERGGLAGTIGARLISRSRGHRGRTTGHWDPTLRYNPGMAVQG
jgi:hypothetical protein